MKYLVLLLALFLVVGCDDSGSSDDDCKCPEGQICNAEKVCVDKPVCDCGVDQVCNDQKVCVDKAECSDTQFATNNGTCKDKICSDDTKCKTGTLGEACYPTADTCDAGLLCIDGKCSDQLKVVDENTQYQLQSHGVLMDNKDQIDDLFTAQGFEYDEDENSETYGTITKYGTFLAKYSEFTEKLVIGNVISFTFSDAAPEGLLFEITSITYTENGILFEIKAASMLSLYKNLRVNVFLPIEESEEGAGGEASGGGDNDDLKDVLKRTTFNPTEGSAEIVFDHKWKKTLDNGAEREYKVEAGVKLGIKPGLEAIIDIGWLEDWELATLKKFRFVPTLKTTLAGRAKATAKIAYTFDKSKYPRMQLIKMKRVVQGSIGPVPISVWLGMGSKVEVELGGEAEVKAEVVHTLKAGIDYVKKRYNNTENFEDDFENVFDSSFDKSVTVSGKVELKTSVFLPILNIGFRAFGAAGLFKINTGPVVEASASFSGDHNFTNGLSTLKGAIDVNWSLYATVKSIIKIIVGDKELTLVNLTNFNGMGINIAPITIGPIKIEFKDGITIKNNTPWEIYKKEWSYIECSSNDDTECCKNSDGKECSAAEKKTKGFCNKNSSSKNEEALCVVSECGKCERKKGTVTDTCNTSTGKCRILSSLSCEQNSDCVDYQYIDQCNADTKKCELKPGRCYDDNDCEGTQFCNYYGSCADICSYKKPCGDNPPANSSCMAEDHKGYCVCDDGYEGDPVNDQCYTECADAGSQRAVPTCDITGGTFMMGCIEGDTLCEDNENPKHEVTVSNFKIDQYEVTVADYKACVDAGKCDTTHIRSHASDSCNYGSDRTNHPMNCITWEGAKEYCEWNGKKLPTEAQWEFVARSGSANNIYPFGTYPTSTDDICSVAVNSTDPECKPGSTKAVGQFGKDVTVNRIHDMGGNVGEWVHDRYSSETYINGLSVPYTDPEGPTCSEGELLNQNNDEGNVQKCPYLQHLYRGGAYNSTEKDVLRATYRAWEEQRATQIEGSSELDINHDSGELVNKMFGVGFRCAQ